MENRPPLQLEHWVHWTLLIGLVLSGLLLIPGLLIVLATAEPRPAGPPAGLAVMVHGALRGDGLPLLELGLLLLMSTPILRVAVLAAGWALLRDWRFAAVACAVLGLLGMSVLLGVG